MGGEWRDVVGHKGVVAELGAPVYAVWDMQVWERGKGIARRGIEIVYQGGKHDVLGVSSWRDQGFGGDVGAARRGVGVGEFCHRRVSG